MPSLYEPLVLNCELLFGLADKLQIPDAARSDIEAILDTESNGIFLTKPVKDAYSFRNERNEYDGAELSKKEMVIPVYLLTSGAVITATVSSNNHEEVIDDFVVTKVEREDEDFDFFRAHVSSKKLKGHKWTDDSKVIIEKNILMHMIRL